MQKLSVINGLIGWSIVAMILSGRRRKNDAVSDFSCQCGLWLTEQGNISGPVSAASSRCA